MTHHLSQQSALQDAYTLLALALYSAGGLTAVMDYEEEEPNGVHKGTARAPRLPGRLQRRVDSARLRYVDQFQVAGED